MNKVKLLAAPLLALTPASVTANDAEQEAEQNARLVGYFLKNLEEGIRPQEKSSDKTLDINCIIPSGDIVFNLIDEEPLLIQKNLSDTSTLGFFDLDHSGTPDLALLFELKVQESSEEDIVFDQTVIYPETTTKSQWLSLKRQYQSALSTVAKNVRSNIQGIECQSVDRNATLTDLLQ